MKQVEKLYVITRRDLTPGYQVAQTAHAVADFCIKQPQIAKHWHTNSNYIICLSAEDESHLYKLGDKLTSSGIPFISFQEPDMGNQTTSIAAFGSNAAKLFSNLGLTLKNHI